MTKYNLFDTHGHMDDKSFEEDREAVFAEIESSLVGLINPGCDRASSEKALAYAERYPFVYAAVGHHPQEIARMTDEDLELLAQWGRQAKVVAIGEIGLDYYYDDGAPRELQRRRFVEQLQLARELDLPVIIHDRDAHGDCLELVRTEGKGVRGVFHCYSGSLETARELLKLGFYLGFGGTSTFKNAAKVREILQQVPQDRILFETDAPYLTPVPYRGKRNKPPYVQLVAENAAAVRGENLENLLEAVMKNVHTLFSKIK